MGAAAYLIYTYKRTQETDEQYFYIACVFKIFNDFNYTFFYRQLDFPSEPRFANEILENEPKSCLAVA